MSIEVRNLRYVYSPGMPGETTALDGVSFEVRDGEMLGVIGHTGSGKSTLLQHLNGLLKPESGEVYVDGPNAHRAARDYRHETVSVNGTWKVHLAPGGGAVLVL